MRLSLTLIAASAALIGAGSAFAQSAPPAVEHSGGPTATAGQSARTNRPEPGTSAGVAAGVSAGAYGTDAAPAAASDPYRSSSRKMTPDPNVERSGGPTATAGTSAQSNVRPGAPAPNNPGQYNPAQ